MDDEAASELQTAIGLWSRTQWGERDPFADGLAIAEEAGEVCRALLKRRQVENGTSNRPESLDHWQQAIRDESADVLITLFSLAENEGFDLVEAARERFREMRSRRREPAGAGVDPDRLIDLLCAVGWSAQIAANGSAVRMYDDRGAGTRVLIPRDGTRPYHAAMLSYAIDLLQGTDLDVWETVRFRARGLDNPDRSMGDLVSSVDPMRLVTCLLSDGWSRLDCLAVPRVRLRSPDDDHPLTLIVPLDRTEDAKFDVVLELALRRLMRADRGLWESIRNTVSDGDPSQAANPDADWEVDPELLVNALVTDGASDWEILIRRERFVRLRAREDDYPIVVPLDRRASDFDEMLDEAVIRIKADYPGTWASIRGRVAGSAPAT